MLTKVGLLLSGATLFASVAVASDRPDWTERAMFTWGDETYFVGVASCAKSVEEGRELAHAAAMHELRHYEWPLGTRFTTQRVFEERPGEGCARGQVNVWRLLKHDGLAKPVERIRPSPTVTADTVTVEGLHPNRPSCKHSVWYYLQFWSIGSVSRLYDDVYEKQGICSE